MTVAPVIYVKTEERWRGANFFHLVELIIPSGLRVYDNMTSIGSRLLLLRLLIGIQDIVNRRIAVAVNSDLLSGLML